MPNPAVHGDLVVGIDFGTSSVRVVVLEVATGQLIGSGESVFPRFESGQFCDPSVNQYRQDPRDHLPALAGATHAALASLNLQDRQRIRAVGLDTTGSSPAPVDQQGTPLSLHPEFAEDPDAMFHLWKDTTAVEAAAEITESARDWHGRNFVAFSASHYSPEWFWAKALHTCRESPRISEASHTWVEHCDWIAGVLTDRSASGQLSRSRCAAGHKAMWNSAFGGYPPRAFFAEISPALAAIHDTLPPTTRPAWEPAGALCSQWAERLGITPGIPVAMGTFDAHAAAVGAGVRPGVPAKTIGTSSSDMIVADLHGLGTRPLSGIEGQAEESILPGMAGIEAGQAAFGDMLNWFREFLLYPIRMAEDAGIVTSEGHDKFASNLMNVLFEQAAALPTDPMLVTGVDWFNGRRAPDGDHRVRGALAGLGLASNPPTVFNSLVEAAVFGTRRIHEGLGAQGVRIESLLTMGGVARKAPFVNQFLADALSVSVGLCESDQTSARGSAIYASVAGGLFESVAEAQNTLAARIVQFFQPEPNRAQQLSRRYQRYLRLCETIQNWTDQTRE